MVLSIFLYFLFGLLFYAIGDADRKKSVFKLSKSNRLTDYSWFFILLFTVISGLRYNLGEDCESYVEYFEKDFFSEFLEKGEYIFAFISKAMRNMGMGRIAYLSFWAFIEVFFFYNALKNRKYLIPFVGLLMMLGPYYYELMNGLRQMVATCIFIFAIQQKIDYGKWNNYIILIIIAIFIHRSSFMLLPFAIIPNIVYFKNRYVVIAVIIICAFLGQQGWLLQYLNTGAALLTTNEMVGYEGYLERIDYFTEDLGGVLSYGPRRLVVLFTTLLIVWFYPEMQKKYDDKFLIFCYTGFILYAIFAENLLTAAHSSLSRPFMYFKFFKLICNAYLLFYLRGKYLKTTPVLYYSVLILSIIYMPLDNVAVAGSGRTTTLFKFIFMK